VRNKWVIFQAIITDNTKVKNPTLQPAPFDGDVP